MPRSTRNRSVSPQKMPAKIPNEKTNVESKQMEKDRLGHQIQEMFKDSVDPEVVLLVLTECEWRVDEAIETLFAISQDEDSEKKYRSKVSNLEVIACSLIGDVDSEQKQNYPHSGPLTTTRHEIMEIGQSPDEASHSYPGHIHDNKYKLDNETLKRDLSPEMAEYHSEPSESAGVSYSGLQSYMDMYKIYGTYVPEIMESIKLGDEHLLSGISPTVGPGIDKPKSLTTASGISEITLRSNLTDGIQLNTSSKHSGKIDTCYEDRRVNADVVRQNRTGETDTVDCISVQSESKMSVKINYLDFEGVTNEQQGMTEIPEKTTKESNSSEIGKEENQNINHKNETSCKGSGMEREHAHDSDVSANVQAMFSSYMSVQRRLEKDVKKTVASEISPVNLSVEAPVFVPRVASSSSVYPPPPPGIDTDHFPNWLTCPPGPIPMFMTPKGPRAHGPRLGHSQRQQHSKWQSSTSPQFQPRPLQPLPGLFAASQTPFRFTGSQGYASPPTSERFPVTDDLLKPQSEPQSSSFSSYCKAASREPLFVPEWAKMSSVKSVETEAEIDSEISCVAQVNKVRSYLDQGKLLLVLLRGLPGSGKSHLARQIVFDGVTLSTDDFFYRCGEYRYKQDQLSDAHNWNKTRARDAMDNRQNPIIVDNTNTMEWEMIPYVRLAVARGYDVEVFEPNTPWKFQPKALCKKNSHGVTRETIRKMNQRYQFNVTAAAMLTKVAQHKSNQVLTKPREESPATQPQSDPNVNVKLVEYESSSDEEEEAIHKPLKKKHVHPPKLLPVKATMLPCPPTIPKLNVNKNQPQKTNQTYNNGGAPTSPRKRRRKKRRVSSSKTEVVQTIEEILESCKKGQMNEEEWKVREEEIQALLFISPVSETEKQDIQVWLTEKLDTMKGTTNDKDAVNLIENRTEDDVQEDIIQTDAWKDVSREFQRTSVQSFDSNLMVELDKMKSAGLSEMIDFAKGVISATAEGNMGDEINLSKINRVDEENRETNWSVENEEDPWSQNQSGPKPRRSRQARTSQNEDAEELEQELDTPKQLEKELEYWNTVKSEVELKSDMNTLESKVIDKTQSEEVVFSWEEPQPQRERQDWDRKSNYGNAETSDVDNPGQQSDEAAVLRTESKRVISEVGESEATGVKQHDLQETLEVVDGDMHVKTEEIGVLGGLQYTFEDVDVVLEKIVTEQDDASLLDAPHGAGNVQERDQDEEVVPNSVKDLDYRKDNQMATGVINTDNPTKRMQRPDNEDNDDVEDREESEEEFKSFDSDDSQSKVSQTDTQGSSSGQQMLVGRGQPLEAEDSFLSVISKEGDYSPEKSDLSFVSDNGEKNTVNEHFEVCLLGLDSDANTDRDHEHDEGKMSPNFNHDLNINHNANAPIKVEPESSESDADICDQKLQSEFSNPVIYGFGNDIEGNMHQSNIEISEAAPDEKTANPGLPSTVADVITGRQEASVINKETLPQKSSTPKKSKSARKRQGNTHSAFLDEEVKQKFQSENWSSFNVTSRLFSTEQTQDNFKNIQPKSKRHSVRSVYSFTGWHDFKFLEEVNTSKPLSQIKNSEKYKVLLGQSRDINIEEVLRKKQHSKSPNSEEENKKHDTLTLEKGSMTDENDLQVPDDVEFLVSTFPEADEDHLRETLNMCQGNVEWTLNLLLDWGASEPFSSIEKKEISYEMKLKTEKTPQKRIKSPVHGQSKSPLSLFDICRSRIEANNLADINELQKRVIKTGHQRLQRMESHSYQRAHSLSLSESADLPGSDSILEDLVNSSSLVSSDVYVSPDKEFSVAGNATSPRRRQLCSPVPATQQLNEFSAVSDWQVEDDWSGTEKPLSDDEAHVKLPVPIELVRDLEELFGPVQSNMRDCEAFEVCLDLRTAKRLFDNLRRRPASRMAFMKQKEAEERARQKQLEDDEAFARKLQEEEDSSQRSQQEEHTRQILPESKAAVRIDTDEPIQRTQRGKGKQACNLMDIMEEERANQQRREEQIKALEATGDHVAISTRLKRQKLNSYFPGVDENFLEEIFEANGFSLEDTVRVLHQAVGKVASPHPKKFLKSDKDEKQLIEDAKLRSLQDLVDQSLKVQEASKPDYQSWESAGVPEYDDIRGEANIHHKMRNECFQKAQEAFRRGMKDVAAFYSQQGHLHREKLKEANMRASQKILEHRSWILIQQGTLDLHGFHVDEAIQILNTVMQEREEEFQARPDKRKQSLFVITGRGRHSKGGVAKLRPAIINHLNNTGYRYVEQQPGLFKIQLQYRA